jgi:DNA-binding NtrC family response regulator
MANTRAQVLVVDDKDTVLEVMSSILGETYDVSTAPDAAAAEAILQGRRFDVVLTDVRMPGASGFDLLSTVKRIAPATSVVMMTGFASISDAVEAIRRGAFDYVAKPLEAEEVRLVIARALAHRGPVVDEVATDFKDAISAARDHASREYLVALMRQFHGNVTHAAEHAGMTRENLHRLLKKYGVKSETFKAVAQE